MEGRGHLRSFADRGIFLTEVCISGISYTVAVFKYFGTVWDWDTSEF